RLNISEKPIVNKYREGKLKRTLKREFKSTCNRIEQNEWDLEIRWRSNSVLIAYVPGMCMCWHPLLGVFAACHDCKRCWSAFCFVGRASHPIEFVKMRFEGRCIGSIKRSSGCLV